MWGMKWRIGLRYADVFFDSQADEPLAAAAAGSGIFERSISNNFWGIGPHAALELNTRRNPWGLGWVGRLDTALLFGEVRATICRGIDDARSRRLPLSGETHLVNAQQVPMLSGFLGLDWRPPCRPNLDILLGYTAEYWWNVGRLSDPDIYNGQSAGEVGYPRRGVAIGIQLLIVAHAAATLFDGWSNSRTCPFTCSQRRRLDDQSGDFSSMLPPRGLRRLLRIRWPCWTKTVHLPE